jgi:hypothetical protein
MLAATAVMAIDRATGRHLAEVGFLLILIAGLWMISAQLPMFRSHATARTIVAGIALAVAGVLLIIATRWGHFG